MAVDGVYSYPASIGSVAQTPGVLLNDVLPPGCTNPTVAATTNPLRGTVTVNADGSVQYIPNLPLPATAADSFQYTVTCDNGKVGELWKQAVCVYVSVRTQGTRIRPHLRYDTAESCFMTNSW